MVEPQELPPLNINSMALLSVQYILKARKSLERKDLVHFWLRYVYLLCILYTYSALTSTQHITVPMSREMALKFTCAQSFHIPKTSQWARVYFFNIFSIFRWYIL